jgi:hypothetical protein
MTHRVECYEVTELMDESQKLYAEYLKWRDEVAMTSKRHPNYSQKLKEFRTVTGRLREAQKRVRVHIKNHGCL